MEVQSLVVMRRLPDLLLLPVPHLDLVLCCRGSTLAGLDIYACMAKLLSAWLKMRVRKTAFLRKQQVSPWPCQI